MKSLAIGHFTRYWGLVSQRHFPPVAKRPQSIISRSTKPLPPSAYRTITIISTQYAFTRQTVKAFGPYLQGAKSIIELGGHGRIGMFAHETFGVPYLPYEGELREPFDIPDQSCDVLLCLEVIEHLKDRISLEHSETDRDCWNYSGVLNLLNESYRILKPGGVLLVTTPNASSVDAIKCILAGDHPFQFEFHVRELTPKQVKAFGEHVGFTLEQFGTFFAWSVCDQNLRSRLLKIIADLGFDTSNRGDDAYYAFRR